MCEPIKRKRYPSDLTDAQWELIKPFIPAVSAQATTALHERREIVNAILYVLRTGCSWRQMPHDLPNGKTAHHYFRIWTQAGIWEPIMAHLRRQVRTQMGRDPEPSAAIIDSQSIKTAPVPGSDKGFDAGKKIYGRKRHVLVDTQGFLLAVKVHAANIVDRVGARLLLSHLPRSFPRLCHLFADKGYTGPLLDWIAQRLHWTTELVPQAHNRSHQHWILVDGQPVLLPRPKTGFQVQRKRWVVERSLAWFTRFRRLARDYEGLTTSSEAFLQLASVRLMLSRLSPFRY
ncbi:IS5 family transposase [Ktedonosporobacter rubrisoli]|uniref:IS5 family transposase n=1 Tax=Ktedonosporobacter rubrisoli TaxID=2509675 RepID=UPI001F5DB3DF|nr:IS5 family transposase [Ktedonosporobacter rubrisoli]